MILYKKYIGRDVYLWWHGAFQRNVLQLPRHILVDLGYVRKMFIFRGEKGLSMLNQVNVEDEATL